MGVEPDASRRKREVERQFDGRAEAYARRRESDPGFRRQIRWVRAAAGRGDGRWALEAGCGAGSLVEPLAEAGFRHVGVDLSARMTEWFARRARGAGLPCRVARADAERLPFPDGAFDLVVAVGLLEYLPRPDPFLREAARVLADGGRLLLAVPAAWSPGNLAARAFASLPRGFRARLLGRDPSALVAARPRPARLGPLRAALRASGFQPGPHRFSQFVFFPWNRIAPRWSEALADLLEPLGAIPGISRLGAQILIAATRAARTGAGRPRRSAGAAA
jgi:SAM-dependent methyltransferase